MISKVAMPSAAGVDRILFGVALLLAQRRLFYFTALLSREMFWVDASLWLLIALWFIHRARTDRSFARFFQVTKRNWILAIFLLISLASLAWSVNLTTSIYRLTVVVCASWIAANLGLRARFLEIVDYITVVLMFLVAMSLAVVVILPEFGVMGNVPYVGSWRGIYWHRNYLGSAMAFANILFLYRVVNLTPKKFLSKALPGIFYLISALLVVMSRSATGVIVLVILHGAFALAWAWARWQGRLSPLHYTLAGAFLCAAGTMIFLNLDFLFGLLGRTTTLTGRVPLWKFILENVLVDSPWLGFGFGALWADRAFRVYMQESLQWDYPVLTGDNGFVDVLLYVGIPGLAVFMLALLQAIVRFVSYAWTQRTLTACIPLVFMVYALAANITLSHFFEIESFTWMVIVSALYAVTPRHDLENPDFIS
jgi:O-antigen ligase